MRDPVTEAAKAIVGLVFVIMLILLVIAACTDFNTYNP